MSNPSNHLFTNWISEERYTCELNPHFSDYGDVDNEKMNEDIKYYLNRYLTN